MQAEYYKANLSYFLSQLHPQYEWQATGEPGRYSRTWVNNVSNQYCLWQLWRHAWLAVVNKDSDAACRCYDGGDEISLFLFGGVPRGLSFVHPVKVPQPGQLSGRSRVNTWRWSRSNGLTYKHILPRARFHSGSKEKLPWQVSQNPLKKCVDLRNW